MKKELTEKLKQYEIKLEQVDVFAKKLPFFAKQIVEGELTGYEGFFRFENTYKKLYVSNGIFRGLYNSDSNRTVTNYEKDYNEYLFSISINCYSLFNHHERFGLEQVADKVDLFFYDMFNTTFYANDEQIIPLLDALNDWYIKAFEDNKEYVLLKKKEKAQEELEKAKKKIKELNK